MGEKLRIWFLQAVKFGLVGVMNTAVDYGVYALLPRRKKWAEAS